jgi:hypothetical protein
MLREQDSSFFININVFLITQILINAFYFSGTLQVLVKTKKITRNTKRVNCEGHTLFHYCTSIHAMLKAIPLQALTGPERSRRSRLPEFKTIGTGRWQGCQHYTPAAFTPRNYSWNSFLLEVESTPGP